MNDSSSPEAVTLDNCDREPIHIPGSIQPHGALLAFDRLGRLSHMSANAPQLLGFTLPLGRQIRLQDLGGNEDIHDAIQHAVAAIGIGEERLPEAQKVVLGGHAFDMVVHAFEDRALCEFELRVVGDDAIDSFSQKAYRSMGRLKRQRSIEKLLDTAVQEVREITGFDRVMAYRFRHDDSGEVVSEARRDDLDAYVGRRYPASDIPAQARRLYVLNTLRLIADVAYRPVPLLADAAHPTPLDLSHSILRSVSPIHIEYLGNMGVGASMSVSIVVGGRLWGMIACHHMAPLQVPYSIRMAADVMAQLIASTVQSLTAQQREAESARAALLRTQVAEQIAQGQDAVDVLAAEMAALRISLGCGAVVLSQSGEQRLFGDIDAAWAKDLVAWLDTRREPMVHIYRAADLPAAADGTHPYCGVLGLCFDLQRRGWLVALRPEQVETIRWGGKPDKETTAGPLGPRLTPRGSFAEWRETVRGTAVLWSEVELETASLLLDSINRANVSRMVEADRLRSQFWAVVGHDMRDPLQSLRMASSLLSNTDASGRMTAVIRNSTNRMQHLLSDLQDITRIQNGLGLAINREPTDLAALLAQIGSEVEAAYPHSELVVEAPATLQVELDPMRFRQVASNLLGNARTHGQGRITAVLERRDGMVVFTASNRAPPLPPELVASLFDPFKRQSLANRGNRGGMGLGLYIVDQIAQAHGGSVSYRAADGLVHFAFAIPATAS